MAALLGLSIAGCGDEGGAGGPNGVPAAAGDTPAVPPGAPYDLSGRQWSKLSQAEQFLAATAFINDNSDRCKGADVGSVSVFVTKSYADEVAPDVAAAEVLAAGCDAGG